MDTDVLIGKEAMAMVGTLALVGGLLSVLLVCSARAGEATSNLVAGLHSKNAWQREAAVKRLIQQRKRAIDALVGVITDKAASRDFNGPRHLAIVALGELRAAEAVGPLCEVLTYLPGGTVRIDELIPSEAYYVAAVALWKIGYPAVNRLEALIRQSRDGTERRLAAWVIMKIEGREQALARMQRWAASRRIGADHFREAKTFIETYRPVFTHPRQAKTTQ